MDEFIGQFFSPTSWSDEKVSEGSSWIDQTGEVCEGNGKNMPATFVPLDSLISESASMFLCEDSSFELDRSLLLGESHSQPGNAHHGSTSSLTGVVDGNSINYNSPERLPFAIDPSTSPNMQPESGSVGSNDSEVLEIQPTFRDSHSLDSIPHLWPPSSYGGISSLPSLTTQDELQSLGLQGQYPETPSHLGNSNFKADCILQGHLPGLQHKMNNHCVPSFADQIPIPQGRTGIIHQQMQFPQSNEGHYIDESPMSPPLHPAAAAINGSLKPRVRARRGQATDPHSIAERLRREKIADRMKNLQQLVPSSNKTDKASMLDEIIEYVKFLQLQVKVLSMSRLGAAGAVVPLITDSQAEGSTGFISSQSNRGLDPFESSNDLVFEQEVVKLMEANMNKAIQFLQSKGLCLMPIALAAAINGSKSKKTVQPIKEEDDVVITGSKTA